MDSTTKMPDLVVKIILFAFVVFAPMLAKARDTCTDVSQLPVWARVLIVIAVSALSMWDTAMGVLAVLFVLSLFVSCSFSSLRA